MPEKDQGFDSSKLLDILGLLGGGAATKLAASKPFLGAIIGPKAIHWNKNNADLATKMERNAHSYEDIYDLTKTYPGHTGGLRQYIPDEGLKAKRLPADVPKEGIPFQDVVDWPETFNNYPWLSDVPIRFNQPNTSYGWGEHINLRGGAAPSGVTRDQLYGLAHEGQHGIAHSEGWPVGKNLEGMKTHANNLLLYRDSLLNTPYKEPYWDFKNPNMEKLINEVGTDPKTVGRELYMRDPGETESRLEETLLKYLKHNDVTPRYGNRLYSQPEAMDMFKKEGLALDTSSSGGNTSYKLRKWLTPDEVFPNQLTFDQRNVWDYLRGSDRSLNPLSTGQTDWLKTGKMYPWKFEDYPRALQNDYDINR